ncbi:uncharacterized protein [Drosophila takahashii]|uniref:uncharacterized protein n=1 Tax=Drosophila takahashii TaxID=29030 RepID=UPI003898DA45
MREINDEDENLYILTLRMTPHQFGQLLEKVKPFIQKKNTCWRNCIGPAERLQVTLRYLATGSTYFNYKGDHSIILMAIADAYNRFIYVDVGVNGRVGDGGVWLHSDLKYAIEGKRVHIPLPRTLSQSDRVSSFTFIADDAFSLTDYMIKRYSHTNLTPAQYNFNYMLSTNRRVVESAVGILNRQIVFKSFSPQCAGHQLKQLKSFWHA